MSEDDFRRLSPDEIAALQRRAQKRNEVIYYAAGMVCATLANLFANRQEHPEPFTPDEFIPRLARPQTDEEMALMGRLWTMALGGEVRTDGGR